MFEILVQREYEKINQEAEFKKREIDYLVNYSIQHFSELKNILRIGGENKDLEEEVFNLTSAIIRESLPEHHPVYGLTMHRKTCIDLPEVSLGLAEAKISGKMPRDIKEILDEKQPAEDSYSVRITEEGFRILDEFRVIRCLQPFQKYIKERQQKMFSIPA